MVGKIVSIFRKILRKDRFRFDYRSDGFAVRNKNLGFMSDKKFDDAYQWSLNFEFEGRKSPWAAERLDIRWRAHICVWAVKQALSLEGDLVECGVDSAILAGTIAKYFDFTSLASRNYYLFDTFDGIPLVENMTSVEESNRDFLNKKFYFESLHFVERKMEKFENIKIVKGFLPDTLSEIKDRKISFLSVDLNNTPSEKAVIERLWGQLVLGAIVVIDDYAFRGHETQYEMWNTFSKQNDRMIATLPTGQGLLLK